MKRVEFPLHGRYSMSRKLKDLRVLATCPLVHVVPREQSKTITVWASDNDAYWTSSKHPEGGPWADPRHLSHLTWKHVSIPPDKLRVITGKRQHWAFLLKTIASQPRCE